MGFVKKTVAVLVLAGIGLAYDTGQAARENEERTRNFSEALVLQEPPMSFREATIYHWGLRLDPYRTEEYMKWRKFSALEDKMKKVGKDDNDKLGVLVNFMRRQPDGAPLDEPAMAIARIGSDEAKHELYSFIVEKSGGNSHGTSLNTASEELYKLDPGMAVDAIIRGNGWGIQIDLLIDFGDEAALNYLIRRGDSYDVIRFLEKNGGKDYIARYTMPMIGLFERSLKGGHVEKQFYFCEEWQLEKYGSAIGSLDRNYLRSHVLPGIRNSCWESLGERKTEQIVAKLY